MSHSSTQTHPDFAQQLSELIAHFEHILPAQAPLSDFVHHNTLHGFQHLPFDEALKTAYQTTGAYGYAPIEVSRGYYQEGRINAADLRTVLAADKQLDDEHIIQQNICAADVYLAALLHPLETVSAAQLNWQIEENKALQCFQPDVEPAQRRALLQADKHNNTESAAISALWKSCLSALNLSHDIVHPEDLQDLSEQQAEYIFNHLSDSSAIGEAGLQQEVEKQAAQQLKQLLSRIGSEWTFSDLVRCLTGEDALQEMNPLFIRYVGGWLDQGIAAWQPPHSALGFYQSWKISAKTDLLHVFDDLTDWHEHLDSLPDDASETIAVLLRRTGIPRADWMDYLQTLALSLPGWAGMFLWRHNHPNYEGHTIPVDMRDYLAVQLVMEHLFVQRICRNTWLRSATIFDLRGHFTHNYAEFLGRYQLFNQHLPEYLISRLQSLLSRTTAFAPHSSGWQTISQMSWIWQQSAASDNHLKGDKTEYSVYRQGWILFRLSQHLGLPAQVVKTFNKTVVKRLFQCLDELNDAHKQGFLWLKAYEIHYRDELFNAVAHNHRHAAQTPLAYNNWATRETRPQAQLIFCMDDREESTRRHLEEHYPAIETLGAAAFFNVVMNWQGLDDAKPVASCPVVATPEHVMREVAQKGQEELKNQHDNRRGARLWLHNQLHHETRRHPIVSVVLMWLSLPSMLLVLLGKLFMPLRFQRLSDKWLSRFDHQVATEVAVTAPEAKQDRDKDNNQAGFTDEEQAERIIAFLRTIGLQTGLSRLVVVMGHGSSSVNNPHAAAYNCGACSGRHSGTNARVFATMINRPTIRRLVAKGGLNIPDDCWFLGAQHNTANEQIDWYDTDKIPAEFHAELAELQAAVYQATLHSAGERCRKLASAPSKPSLKTAYEHVVQRTTDLSQTRPELGHSTNAIAFIGRRSLSRGLFLDRRAYLISYDYTTDPEGLILERILLTAGPVGAGISLEYYFSTVNNERYGCGLKTMHNLTGLFGVMEGASSDLRTGLPWQMLDIHEPMRLQVMLEAKIDIVTTIYQRQPPLQELVGKGWLLLSVKDPDSGEISVFDPDVGFVPWSGEISDLNTVRHSVDYYQDQMQHLPPALVFSQ